MCTYVTNIGYIKFSALICVLVVCQARKMGWWIPLWRVACSHITQTCTENHANWSTDRNEVCWHPVVRRTWFAEIDLDAVLVVTRHEVWRERHSLFLLLKHMTETAQGQFYLWYCWVNFWLFFTWHKSRDSLLWKLLASPGLLSYHSHGTGHLICCCT